jgi:hypothetical protein
MARCAGCGSTIVFGGVTQGEYRYCKPQCVQMHYLATVAEGLPVEDVMAAVQSVHQGSCPSCQGPGPVDFRSSHFVWSIVLLTRRSSKKVLCCKRCGNRDALTASLGSFFLGWWGFPWGVIYTPMQIIRNISEMSGGPDPTRPSNDLITAVRIDMARHVLPEVMANLQAQPQDAPVG